MPDRDLGSGELLVTPSVELYAIATQAQREAALLDHQGDHDPSSGFPLGRCLRCHLDARARLYDRAGDSALELERRGPWYASADVRGLE